MENLYIALVRAEGICPQEEWPNGLAVYYDPGSVSTETCETLSRCFLHQFSDGDVAIWSSDDCRLSRELANEAISKLNKERRRVDTNLPDNWSRGIHPKMRQWARVLYRLRYFEPKRGYIEKMLRLVQTGNTLSENQITSVQEIYQERGSVAGLRKRQLIRWRLMRLSEIGLDPKDKKTVSDFTHYAEGKIGLHKTKEPVIGALQEKYWRQRLEATQRRAERIAAMLSG